MIKSNDKQQRVVNAVMLSEKLRVMKNVKGGKYVLYLMKNPNRDVPYFYLEQCFSKYDYEPIVNIESIDILCLATNFYFNQPIPMCDLKTKVAIENRVKLIDKKIEHALLSGFHNILPELYEEKQQLILYLAEVLTASGQIKNFEDSLNKPKRAIQMSIKRFFEELSQDNIEFSQSVENLIKYDKYTLKYVA